MEPFTTLTGVVMPLARTNVNTDEITPARFLKTIKRNGFSHEKSLPLLTVRLSIVRKDWPDLAIPLAFML